MNKIDVAQGNIGWDLLRHTTSLPSTFKYGYHDYKTVNKEIDKELDGDPNRKDARNFK